MCCADAISATNPRVIDDSRARKLSNDLKRCTYYETCATYGLNVERVFQDVAQKVVALRKKQQLSIGPCKSLPNSPSHSSVSAASIPSVHINQGRDSLGFLWPSLIFGSRCQGRDKEPEEQFRNPGFSVETG
ncbi:UNVERIFIED_CONTAM: hypothetical protein H355_003856 [Colinus virginianus]|nr:hypothetical protein H355_003856 [Colinus virginianus]